MGRALIVIGLVLVATGLLWPWIGKLPIGHLPGDVVIERGSTTIYLPLGTGLLLSILLSALLWLLSR